MIIQYGPDGESYNLPLDRRFAGFNKTYVKELCHDPIWISTCANVCYMADPTRPVTSIFGKEAQCRDICDMGEYFRGRDYPGETWIPGTKRQGYSANGEWYARPATVPSKCPAAHTNYTRVQAL